MSEPISRIQLAALMMTRPRSIELFANDEADLEARRGVARQVLIDAKDALALIGVVADFASYGPDSRGKLITLTISGDDGRSLQLSYNGRALVLSRVVNGMGKQQPYAILYCPQLRLFYVHGCANPDGDLGTEVDKLRASAAVEVLKSVGGAMTWLWPSMVPNH